MSSSRSKRRYVLRVWKNSILYSIPAEILAIVLYDWIHLVVAIVAWVASTVVGVEVGKAISLDWSWHNFVKKVSIPFLVFGGLSVLHPQFFEVELWWPGHLGFVLLGVAQGILSWSELGYFYHASPREIARQQRINMQR